MGINTQYSPTNCLSNRQIDETIQSILGEIQNVQKVLIIHPDYSRNDFTHIITPLLYQQLKDRGLRHLDFLNAGGTHRPMTDIEVKQKLGIASSHHSLIKGLYNHEFDRPEKLVHVVNIPENFVAEKTHGHLKQSLPVSVNKLITENYDTIIAISGTVPHEALGFSGGTKIFFPGISGPDVIGLLHWAAVLIGIPQIIGTLNNPAREVVNLGAKHIFNFIKDSTIISLNMVYSEDNNHQVIPKGLFGGVGFEGFTKALEDAAELSSKLHIVYLDEPKNVVVQQLPAMYDEIWTAGKGSYKLQKQGVIAEGGEIILYAPHIDCFHSNAQMDQEMRQIGYHGREYVIDYCEQNPTFNKNVAAHVINVRGLGSMINGKEYFPFKVTLATKIPQQECEQVGLGWADYRSLNPKDFQGPGRLWIHEGGQWLYSR